MATFTEHLRSRGVDGLVELLDRRRDLSAPPPASVRALAARAGTRASLDTALATADAGVLATLNAVLALAPTTADAICAALGGDATGWLADAQAAALVWPDDDGLRPAPGLADVLGPYPAGLGPSLTQTLARRSSDALAELAGMLGTSTDGLTRHLADPGTVNGLLESAPPGAHAVLDALAWGPPVGRAPRPDGAGHTAVTWLLRRGLLAVGDPQHVLLPREVALALRGGRVVPAPPIPPAPTPTPVDDRAVAGEAAHHALEAVRLMALVVEDWGHRPVPSLRAGGLGARELKRLAGILEVEPHAAALIVEVAGTARLVADDGAEQPSFCPTSIADDWTALDVTQRWADLARAWLMAERAPWLVGTRDETGVLRGALDPAHRRMWVPRLRAAVLGTLAGATGRLEVADVLALLAWRAPRSVPTEHAVRAVLDEAALLGLTGAGALAEHARALVHGWDGTEPPIAVGPGGVDLAAAALARSLPPPVDEVLLGGDLTGIVPGRPTDALAALLARTAQVESRGAGLTVRFTEASIRGALDTAGAQEILAALTAHARGGVPQPLAYLITDAARRHGQVRAGAAGAYLRGDPASLAALADAPALRGLGLRTLAPGVLVALVTPVALVEAVRNAGLPAVLEDADGLVVRTGRSRHRVRVRHRPLPTAEPGLVRHRLERVARDLLAEGEPHAQVIDGAARGDQPRDQTGDAARTGTDPGALAASGTPEPAETLAVLREAAAGGGEVWLEIAGPDGPTSRRVQVLHVDGGRVRVLDRQREAELVVATHRIVAAEPVGAPTAGDPDADNPSDVPTEPQQGDRWTGR
jgi:hypothetical protein